ncbi:MAG: GNAT family N-acetyltransferase [Spirulinaceae cyanobacterium]
MNKEFITQRLLLRPWQPQQDAQAAWEIYGDREVMRYIGDGKVEKSITSVRDRLQLNVDRYDALNNGTGYWAAVEKATGQLIGAIILKQLPDAEGKLTQDVEIGWHLRRRSWGQGYATEGAKKILEYGFDSLNLPVIYAITRAENKRSIRVMERLKMLPLGTTDKYYGIKCSLFQLKPPNTPPLIIDY